MRDAPRRHPPLLYDIIEIMSLDCQEGPKRYCSPCLISRKHNIASFYTFPRRIRLVFTNYIGWIKIRFIPASPRKRPPVKKHSGRGAFHGGSDLSVPSTQAAPYGGSFPPQKKTVPGIPLFHRRENVSVRILPCTRRCS